MNRTMYKFFSKHYKNWKMLSGSSCSVSTEVYSKSILKNIRRREKIKTSDLALLGVPMLCTGLGIWQIRRLREKETFLKMVTNAIRSPVVELPENLDDLRSMEYRPIRVYGHYLHDREMHVGPRGCLNVDSDQSVQASIVFNFQGNVASKGYIIITPFKLANREETILINRGWVSSKYKEARMRKEGQIGGNVEVVGLYRKTETSPSIFTAKHNKAVNEWLFKDVHEMSKFVGSSPVLLDANINYNVPNGPLGGQTKLQFKNDHLSYIITWFALAAGTTYQWFKKCAPKR